jgi:hypothetical protein
VYSHRDSPSSILRHGRSLFGTTDPAVRSFRR